MCVSAVFVFPRGFEVSRFLHRFRGRGREVVRGLFPSLRPSLSLAYEWAPISTQKTGQEPRRCGAVWAAGESGLLGGEG